MPEKFTARAGQRLLPIAAVSRLIGSGKWNQRRADSVGIIAPFVRLRELPEQQLDRPVVDDRVVEREEKDAVRRCPGKKLGPPEGRGVEFERAAAVLDKRSLDRCTLHRRLHQPRHLHRRDRQDSLERAVATVDKAASQRPMASHGPAERPPQTLPIDRSIGAKREWLIVGGPIGKKGIEEQHAPLGRERWEDSFFRNGGEGLRCHFVYDRSRPIRDTRVDCRSHSG